MAVTQETPGPYAPASAIGEVMNRYRARGMQVPFNRDVLVRAGVSDSLVPRTLQALRTLELIRDDGMPTENLETLRRAPESDFKAAMATWLKSVYAEVFSFVDAADDETRIRDAFRNYQPHGQQERMVALFVGLCRMAGLRGDEPQEPRPRQQVRKVAASVMTIRRTMKQTPAAMPGIPVMPATTIPAPIMGMLSGLPQQGTEWTKTEREKFMHAFGTILDYCYPVTAKGKVTDDGK